MKKTGSATDPLWYKDAIIYEIHVRAFQDSNDDGIGDFPGLMSRLDYLQDLGVTCLWLLPFFPSPLRDDGYDIANYVDVNPSYGTLDDFKSFLAAAHQRGMQVMIELVINHTSDQHPWFQQARLAPPGSPARDMYVWSETDKLYDGVRIIFTDTEKSNWTWDDTAKAFYWHRFFSHQPDLNFDHPRVMEEVLSAMRFWLDMGVDALRLDAIPYLIERDGTSCENVPETHVKIKEVRAALDAEYSNRLILAEANMWPADVRPYFGDGDECHMAFHFPLMPRIYMALRQEDRLPITDIMAQTPPIPESCQWGLFLRNHDELTLEMVTNDERDYMYLAYSADPRMRINVGIRRRLAPLVDNNRRRIELLNSLLLSFPGTPILYYGDEIGMGDNIYLGDRNGVRTPMQWNSDRNAGFSHAVPARLYFPVIMDPIWGYQAINVEAQQSDQSSLLHWTRNMIALRKLFQVFGRGSLEFLHPENRKILAYLRDLRRDDGSQETVLCVANLSRFAQPVSLDLTAFAGMIPVEMLGYVSFPAITTAPYPLTVAPYGFLWFELQPAPVESHHPLMQDEEPTLNLSTQSLARLEDLFTGPAVASLEQALCLYLPRQRWFGAKSRKIHSVQVADWATLSPTSLLAFLKVTYAEAPAAEPETYQLPLALSSGHPAQAVRAAAPNSIVASVTTPAGPATLHDATAREEDRQALLTLIQSNSSLPLQSIAPATSPSSEQAPSPAQASSSEKIPSSFADDERPASPPPAPARPSIQGRTSSAFHLDPAAPPLPARLSASEQSNTSVLYDATFILKLFRRLQPGENPDTEIGRFLTETARFPRIAPFLGDLTLLSHNGQPTTLAMLQGLVANQGDAWQSTLEELARFYESCSPLPAPADLGQPATFLSDDHAPALAREHAGLFLDAAALLGRRTAELHLALATPTDDPDFASEPFTAADLADDANRIERQIARTFEALKHSMSALPDESTDDAALLLSSRLQLIARARKIAAALPAPASAPATPAPATAGQRIRIHGDFHLGQVLLTRGDFVFLDFEGEPARPLAERRRKQSPLKDVAGMLRSFSYAAASALEAYTQRHPETARTLAAWSTLWLNAVSTEFLRAYRAALRADPDLIPAPAQAQTLLNAYLLEKALYELLYELDNRPDWVRIPLAGILALAQ